MSCVPIGILGQDLLVAITDVVLGSNTADPATSVIYKRARAAALEAAEQPHLAGEEG
jgi:hypothetical protein